MMTIEGFFTSSELAAALRLGAQATPARFNKKVLSFPTEDDYRQWEVERQDTTPALWTLRLQRPVLQVQ